MTNEQNTPSQDRWAHLRFSVVGPLLASPPPRGELRAAIGVLVAKEWVHPTLGIRTRFAASTIERWYYEARSNQRDPVRALRKKARKDLGLHPSMPEPIRQALLAQYRDHRGWSGRLHYDNLAVRVKADPKLGPLPSYSTLRRFMRAMGLFRQHRPKRDTEGARLAAERLDRREVRSYEATHVHGLWHSDFHHARRAVLTARGEWVAPIALGVLDDRSRLLCHMQWYLSETAEDFVHGVSQAIEKRGAPRALMTDNGPAMIAAETEQGLPRLSIVHETTLPYSPFQNAKQEAFWAQVEGRFMAMLEGVKELTLARLNEATQAWAEMEYNRKTHSELGESPLARYLAGPDVGRPSPSSDELRLAFTRQETRTPRLSDGTLTVEGRRFEIPSRYRHLTRVAVRYAHWDLSYVHLADVRTGVVLCRIYPLDKEANADGVRRTLEPGPLAAVEEKPVESGPSPLLVKLMEDYAATGLPPAYLPKEERP